MHASVCRLQLMHSQTKAAAPTGCLGMEPAMQRVLMATCSGSSQEPFITSHSLSLESGFLAEQPAYLLRPLRPAGAPAFQCASQVPAPFYSGVQHGLWAVHCVHAAGSC
jgi:hypothetical protein